LGKSNNLRAPIRLPEVPEVAFGSSIASNGSHASISACWHSCRNIANGQTGRQTDRQADRNTSHPYRSEGNATK